ncbi:MAG: protoporphyrinogen oxidase [Elusimicrobiota bacterium]
MSARTPFRVVVAGGGASGLAAAFRLQTLAKATRIPLELHLLEASERFGGCIRTSRREGFLIESGPDCFLSEKIGGLKLIQELGLSDQLLNTHSDFRRSFILRQNVLYPIPEGFYLLAPSRLLSFLRSPMMSWSGKVRLLMEPLIQRRSLPDESLASFVRRRMGSEALEQLAQPLIAGIYAADPETLSLRATFPRFIEMEHGGGILWALQQPSTATRQASGARYSLFVTLRDGLQTLTDALENALPPESLHRGTTLRRLVFSPDTQENIWHAETDQGFLMVDAVVLALPAYASAQVLSELGPALAESLASIPYGSVATLNLAYRSADVGHALDGFGYVAPAREGRPVMACTFVHRKFAGRVPEGYVLLRAFLGGASQESLLANSDAELTRLALSDLSSLLNIKWKPLWTSLQRWPRSMPQYTVGHLDRLEAIERGQTQWPGLALAGNWRHGVGVPDCLESGGQAAEKVWEWRETLGKNV